MRLTKASPRLTTSVHKYKMSNAEIGILSCNMSELELNYFSTFRLNQNQAYIFILHTGPTWWAGTDAILYCEPKVI